MYLCVRDAVLVRQRLNPNENDVITDRKSVCGDIVRPSHHRGTMGPSMSSVDSVVTRDQMYSTSCDIPRCMRSVDSSIS